MLITAVGTVAATASMWLATPTAHADVPLAKDCSYMAPANRAACEHDNAISPPADPAKCDSHWYNTCPHCKANVYSDADQPYPCDHNFHDAN